MTAAIYARKSTDQSGISDEQRSVARQVEHARAYAIRKGWRVTDEHVYVDDGISGAEFANRPGFLRLMNALKPRAMFQVLIMSEESRLGREAIETAYAPRHCQDVCGLL
jgi:DNA invertase Pin-like site-specific DNA recombinase